MKDHGENDHQEKDHQGVHLEDMMVNKYNIINVLYEYQADIAEFHKY